MASLLSETIVSDSRQNQEPFFLQLNVFSKRGTIETETVFPHKRKSNFKMEIQEGKTGNSMKQVCFVGKSHLGTCRSIGRV